MEGLAFLIETHLDSRLNRDGVSLLEESRRGRHSALGRSRHPRAVDDLALPDVPPDALVTADQVTEAWWQISKVA